MKKIAFQFFLLIVLALTSCGDSQSTKQSANLNYKPKRIEYNGKNYKKFRKAAEKVINEYRAEITEALHEENWELVNRELLDYWELVDGMTPSQTGSIWENEAYQNAYDNFAAKTMIEEARMLIDKQDDSADEILLEMLLTVKPTTWSTVDKGSFSKSDKETVIQKAAPTIIKLAKLKGRTKILEFLSSPEYLLPAENSDLSTIGEEADLEEADFTE